MEEQKLNKEINPWLIVATFIIFILINLFFYNSNLLLTIEAITLQLIKMIFIWFLISARAPLWKKTHMKNYLIFLLGIVLWYILYPQVHSFKSNIGNNFMNILYDVLNTLTSAYFSNIIVYILKNSQNEEN